MLENVPPRKCNTDCHVARMTWRLNAAKIEFSENVFHSYTPNPFNAGHTVKWHHAPASTIPGAAWAFPVTSCTGTIYTTGRSGVRRNPI